MSNSKENNCPKCGAAIPGDAPGGICPKCALEGAASAPTVTGGRNTPPPTVAEIAPHFPDLEIIDLIGAGGMGAVYKVRQPNLDRFVALKILSHDLSEDPAFAERFNREARVLARLSHPNIVGIFDFGTAGPYCYFLMELVDGVNLRQAMQAGRFSPAESLAMVEDICAALKFAHEEGILHRDIKPENVLIDSKGRVKIADFGIAKLVGDDQQHDVTLTMQGSVLGSPHYMAPEQFETPGDVDQRADIYSLGVVFYELLTGELPIGRFALPSEKAAMDARIDDIVLRTLQKERQARFQTAEEVMTQVGVVSQTPGAPAQAPVPAQPDSGTARFSLTGAILTGLSLVGVVGGLTVMNGSHELGLTRPTAQVLSAIMFILSGMMAITGFIFGSVALASIRKSGGVLGGLGSSVFAAVVWPILLLGVFGTAFLSIPRPDSSGGRSVGPFIVMLFIGVPQILAAFVLVRGLRRWARGVVKKDGERHFPGLGRTILGAIGLIVLGVVSLEVSSRVFPGSKSERISHVIEARREMAREESRILSMQSTSNTSPEDVVWFRGAPEVRFPVEVYPGIRADFRLVRYQGTDQDPEYAPMGTLLGMDGNGDWIRSIVEIGCSGPKGEAGEGERGFTGLLDLIDCGGTLPVESDFAGWQFDPDQRETLQLVSPWQHDIQIATRKEQVDGEETIAETLKLEINVTRR